MEKILIRIQSLFFNLLCICLLIVSGQSCNGDAKNVLSDYLIYPDVNEKKPQIPSPYTDIDGDEYVLAVTKLNKYAIIDVTLHNNHGICKQLVMDTTDFPNLIWTGLHSEEQLNQISTITGRSLEEITQLGQPKGLSYAGFMAEDETILSVIKADNQIVSQLRLTHPQLAKPLFHILNMMDADLALDRWNMARHRWDNICSFYYNNQKVNVEAFDTKGGQLSIFDDRIQGAFHVKLWRDLNDEELHYLGEVYHHLSAEEFDKFKTLLSTINMGEMQPQYIMRYGFYEGHTFWRTDPVTISYIFGLKTIQELDSIFSGKLDQILTNHFIE